MKGSGGPAGPWSQQHPPHSCTAAGFGLAGGLKPPAKKQKEELVEFWILNMNSRGLWFLA